MSDVDRKDACRITDQQSLKGLRTVVMENELLRITILADKGSDIYEFLYKPLDIDFMWHSPLGLRNPHKELASDGSSANDFLDFYEGGWQEILPSGGGPCVYKGIEYGLHDEVCNLTWEHRIIEDTGEEISCEFSVLAPKSPLRLIKKLTLRTNEAKLHIEETLSNESSEIVDVMWGHHLVFGEPFLDQNCRLDTKAQKIRIEQEVYAKTHRFEAGAEFDWPIAKSREGKDVDFRQIPERAQQSEDMCYLLEFTEPWYALTHTERKVSFALRWSSVFQYLWYWQVFGASGDYPWPGSTYNIGLEPWTSMPGLGLAEAVKRGTQLTLQPNQTVNASLVAAVAEGFTEVGHVSANGTIS